MKIDGMVQELWLDTSFGPKWSKCSSRPRPQSQGIFPDIMILVDSSYDSGKNEVLLVKIGDTVLDLQLDTSFAKDFDKVISVYSQKIAKNSIKILVFGAIPDM